MNKEVKTRYIEIEKIATIRHKGSLRELNLIYKQLKKWIENKNFKITGDICYFRFDPKYKDLSLDNMIFEMGIPVKNRNKDKDFVTIVEIPERDVISALYRGPYFNLPSIHGILEDYARKNELAPMDSPTEIYLNDPAEVKSSELLTEVQFTVLDYKPENIHHVPLVNKIERKIIKKQRMAIIEHYGSIEDVYKIRINLVKWAEKRNIKVNTFHFKYHLSSDGISPRGMVFKVAIPVDGDVKEEDDIKIVEIQEHEVLSALYKGPYINLPSVHRMIVNYAFENDLELIDFPTEIYLNSIFDVSCDDLLTEVRIQVVDFKLDKNVKLGRKIERKTIKRHKIAFIRQKGSFEKINKLKTDLFNWTEKNNIKTSGHYFLKFRNHPRSLSQENIYYDVGVPLDSDVDFIKVVDLLRHKALSLIHKGSISTLKYTHDFVKDHAITEGFIPFNVPINVVTGKIPENIEDELSIEVLLPIKGIDFI